jgi:menaquinol-cytochrome c reductase iron-sulfur subunit
VNEATADHPLPGQPLTPGEITRRRFLEKVCVALGSVCAAILGIPIVGFVVTPIFRKTTGKWVSVGKISDFQIGNTIKIDITDPSPLPWAGITAKSALWLRRVNENEFIAFSVNCTHLGCPVRWLADADLFMCPCHGGVYYEDGTVAAGPPPKPLIRYDVRTANGQVEIKTMAIPITSTL